MWMVRQHTEKQPQSEQESPSFEQLTAELDHLRQELSQARQGPNGRRLPAPGNPPQAVRTWSKQEAWLTSLETVIER